jgi:glutathione S-transferase
MALTLVIGDKTYSSWSMRPWLGLKAAGLSFEERQIRLDQPDTAARVSAVSPAGKVPILIEDGLVIHESIAILERVAELAPDAGLWPDDPAARAVARAVSAEMHAGFQPLRAYATFNLKRENQPRATPIPEAVQADITRICAIWADCRPRFGAGGPFLFGRFGVADCMYAPVVGRFVTYGLPRDAVADAYIAAITSHPAWLAWKADALKEDWKVGKYEFD